MSFNRAFARIDAIAMGSALVQRSNLVTIGLIVLFTLVYYLPFFDLSKDVVRVSQRAGERSTDLTPQFGIHAEIWRTALIEHGELPHWSPYIMGGAPFLAAPGTNLLSLTNALALVFRGQVAARLSIPVHVLLGWIGLLLFVRAVGLPDVSALVAGLIYLFNPSYMGFHALTGHLNVVHGVAFAPWVLYVAVRPFQNPWSRYLLTGIVLALTIHAGAPTLCLYIAGCGFPALVAYRVPRDGWRIAACGGLLAAATAAGAGAVRALPAMALLRVSDRQFGMSPESGFFSEYPFRLAEAWFVWLPLLGLFAVGGTGFLK